MIKNKNLQMGLIVFFITLIALIVLAEFYPNNSDSNALQNESELTADKKTQKKLEIAVK